MKNKGANLFPVATGVQIPYVGNEVVLDMKGASSKMQHAGLVQGNAFKISSRKGQTEQPKLKNISSAEAEQKTEDYVHKFQQLSQKQLGSITSDKSKNGITKNYLHTISSGLVFSEDVIKDRGKWPEQYSSADKPFLCKGAAKDKAKHGILNGRNDARCPVVRHYPCHVPNGYSIQSLDVKTRPLPSINKTKMNECGHNLRDNQEVKGRVAKKQVTWDEYLMTLLSRETAEMVIKEFTAGEQNSKLCNVLQAKYDKATNTSIIADEKLSKQRPDSSEIKKSLDLKKNTEPLATDTESTKRKEMVFRSNNKVYDKVLETEYPSEADNWYKWDCREKGKKSTKKAGKKGKKIKKGMQKWCDYPRIVEVYF